MNLLVVRAIGDGDVSVDCTFTATIDAAPTLVDGLVPTLEIPSGASTIELVCTPSTPYFWEAKVTLDVAQDEEPVASADSNGTVAVSSVSVAGHRVSVAVVQLSRLKEVTADVLAALTRPPKLNELIPKGQKVRKEELTNPPPGFPPTEWSTPERTMRVIDVATPVVDGLVSSATQQVAPDNDDLVFAVAGVDAPRLIAVSWPRAIARTEGAPPTPFFVFWRPGVAQNVPFGCYEGPGHEPYPYSYDYAYFGLLQSMRLRADTYATAGPKGVPYQVEASGKHAVSVMPCNRVGPEFGVFNDARSLDLILRDIQRVMFRREGASAAPTALGRVAFGAFSSGNPMMASFLASPANRAHALCADALQEVYFFDPPDRQVDECVRQALLWAGGVTDAMIRLYTRDVKAAHSKLLGRPTPTAPFVEQSADRRFSAGAIPVPIWHRTAELAGFPKLCAGINAWQDAHQVIPALFLTHALSLSRF